MKESDFDDFHLLVFDARIDKCFHLEDGNRKMLFFFLINSLIFFFSSRRIFINVDNDWDCEQVISIYFGELLFQKGMFSIDNFSGR